jgi:capsular polysaccharide biosynthesis protein
MKIDTPGDFVLALKNGRIYSSDHSNFATISQDGYVLEEVSFQWGLMEERILEAKKNRVFKTKGFTKPNVYRGKVFSLLSGGGAKYYLYHWLTEAIPKMYLFQQSGLLDHNSHFIIPSQQFSYHQEYLKYFGIGKDRIIDEQSVHHIQADWLYVTSHVKYFDHHPNWSLDFLYKSTVLQPQKKPTKRIYISRADAGRNRPVHNEADFEMMLSKHGFESVQLTKLTVFEKAAVFNSANIVVGVHGGGLVNLVFCEPGTTVLEIFPDKYVRHAYYDIADKRSLRYEYMLLPTIGDATDALRGQTLGLVIDVEKVEAKIAGILNNQRSAS